MKIVQTDNLPPGILSITTNKVWINDPPPKPKGRPKGAKDLKPRKVAKHGPYRRGFKK